MTSEKITFILNKLVRDKVYCDMVTEGMEKDVEFLEGEQKKRALVAKIKEELVELENGDDDTPVDVGSALLAYAREQGYTAESFLEAVKKKDNERGAFDGGYFVRSVTLEPDSPWVEYYRKDPEKYKELEQAV